MYVSGCRKKRIIIANLNTRKSRYRRWRIREIEKGRPIIIHLSNELVEVMPKLVVWDKEKFIYSFSIRKRRRNDWHRLDEVYNVDSNIILGNEVQG